MAQSDVTLKGDKSRGSEPILTGRGGHSGRARLCVIGARDLFLPGRMQPVEEVPYNRFYRVAGTSRLSTV